jgi:dolichyl-phosphate-mannose-protein mannosyltransferase
MDFRDRKQLTQINPSRKPYGRLYEDIADLNQAMPLIVPRPSYTKPSRPMPRWFSFGMAGIFLGSLLLRFWGLTRFNTLVFDEVYYAKFASAFLKDEIVFTGHPPLSTYIVAIGIWIGQHLPWGQGQPQNDLTGLMLSPFSYRWLNAFTGALIPPLVGAIAYQLTQRYGYALIAALLMAADGLFLVESRYALNNIYLVIFGLLGHLFLLLAFRAASWRRWFYLGLAGIWLGGAASIKWNGLGFLLGAQAIWGIGWLLYWIQWLWSRSQALSNQAGRAAKAAGVAIASPDLIRVLSALAMVAVQIVVALALVPALTYYVSWIPYIQVDASDSDFWQLQAQTLDYHKRVGGIEAHPYCSRWYTWPLMLRPVAYYYQTIQGEAAAPIYGPPLPANATNVIYDVHAMGNPILWWFSTVAVVLLAAVFVTTGWQKLALVLSTSNRTSQPKRVEPARPVYFLAIGYLLINWAANFLPWVRVTRCLFIYHYMESLVFAILLLALVLDRWLHSAQAWRRMTALAVIGLVMIGFMFWMPLFLGLPLSPEALELRRWLMSWV